MKTLTLVALAVGLCLLPVRSESQARPALTPEDVKQIDELTETFAKGILAKEWIGKAERFIQTLMREWAYVRPYTNSARRTRALRPWLRAYNIVRPHAALGYQPPCVRFPRLAQ